MTRLKIFLASLVLLMQVPGLTALHAQTGANRYSTKLVLLGNAAVTTPLTLQAPASGLTSYALTLPPAVGANGQTLVTTNATGTLGWLSLAGSNSGDVTLAGSANYLTISGQVMTRNAIDLANASNTTGALPIARGGTNATAALSGAARPIVSNGTAIVENNATLTNNRLPKWSTTSVGNFADASITDDGTTVSTNEPVRLGTASSSTGSLALANTSSANLTTIQAGNATAAVTYKLPTANGSSNQILVTDGNNPAQLSWSNRSGSIVAGQTSSNVGSSTQYFYPDGPTAGNNTTLSFSVSEMIMPRAGTIQDLYVGLTTAPGSGSGQNFTVYNVTTATALSTVTVSGTSTQANSGSATLSVAAGDIITVKHTVTSAPANAQAVWSFEIR